MGIVQYAYVKCYTDHILYHTLFVLVVAHIVLRRALVFSALYKFTRLYISPPQINDIAKALVPPHM